MGIVIAQKAGRVEMFQPGPRYCLSVSKRARRVGRAVDPVCSCAEKGPALFSLEFLRNNERKFLIASAFSVATNLDRSFSTGKDAGWGGTAPAGSYARR